MPIRRLENIGPREPEDANILEECRQAASSVRATATANAAEPFVGMYFVTASAVRQRTSLFLHDMNIPLRSLSLARKADLIFI